MWSVAEADFPSNGSPRQRLGFSLKYAALAPTESNRQPWEFRLTDTHLELLAKEDPALELIDPDGRELLIACGAALHHLKLALKHFGCLGRVELFPDLDQSGLVARIHFGFSRERDAQEKLLFEAMTARNANLAFVAETPVSEMMLTVLSRAVATERGWLDFAQSEASRQRVVEIVRADEQPGLHLNRPRPLPMNLSADGPASRWPKPLFAFGGRNVDSQSVMMAPGRSLAIPPAILGVVKTKTDDKHGWLAAGQTLARVVLQAQVLGLAWAFFHPVRRREAREALRTGVGHKGFAQVILRFGPLSAGETVRLNVPTTATATSR